MKVFQIVNVRWYNATAWYGVQLGALLREAGHEVLVIGLADTPPLRQARELGLDTLALPLNSANPVVLLGCYRRMAALVRDLRPDIVNCHRGEGFFLWGLLRRQHPWFRLVRTRGDQRPPKNSAANRLLHNRIADAVILTNQAAARHCRKVLGTPPQKLWTIYGGVDDQYFRFDPVARERIRREFGFSANDCVVGLLGRFDTVKGQRELIQAVARLRQDGFTQLKLLLIGHDSALPQSLIQEWVREHGLEEQVRITGRRQDVPACIAALDLGVVASLWSEAIARAALEIMACQRPLLGTSVGVMPDLLDPEALCPPGEQTALEALLARALRDPAWLQELQERQQQRLPQLTHREFLRETLAVYQSLLPPAP